MPDYTQMMDEYLAKTGTSVPKTDVPTKDPSDSPVEAYSRMFDGYSKARGWANPEGPSDDIIPPHLKEGPQPAKDPRQIHMKELGSADTDTIENFFGEPGFTHIGARADLALNKNFENTRRKFIEKYPEGKLEEMKDGTWYFKMNDADKWHLYDPGPTEKFDLNEIGGDIADMSGAAVPAAAEFLATKNIPGGSSLRTWLLRSFAGAGAGQLALEAEEGVRGYGNTPKEVLQNVGAEGGLAAAGTGGMHALTSTVNAVSGRGLFSLQPNAQQMKREADALGLRPLMPHQLFDHPLIRRIGILAQEHSPQMQREYFKQVETAAERMAAIESRQLPQELPEIMQNYLDSFRDDMRRLAVTVRRLPEETGNMINAAVERYKQISRTGEMAAYRQAQAVAPETFNISAAKSIADRALSGTPMGAGTRMEATGLFDAAGRPITREVPNQENVAPITSEFRRLLERVRLLDDTVTTQTQTLPNGTTRTVDPFEQIIDLRNSVLEHKTLKLGELGDKEVALANEMYDALTNSIKGRDGFPAWEYANTVARERRETLETWAAVRAQKAGSTEEDAMAMGPYGMAKSLIKPGAAHHLDALRRTMSNQDWEHLRDFFRSDIVGMNLDDMAKINKRLDSYKDSRVLDMLLQPNEATALRELGTAAEKLKKSNLPNLAAENEATRPLMEELISSPKPLTANELIKLRDRFAGRAGPSLDIKLKEGLIDAVANKVFYEEKGNLHLNQAAFDTVMKQMEHNGTIKFLGTNQQELLKTFQKYAQFVTSVPSDMGTSQAATETASGFLHLKQKALFNIIKYSGIGRAYANGTLNKILSGWSSGSRFDLPKIKSLTGAIATLSNDSHITGNDAFYEMARDKTQYLKDKAMKTIGKGLDTLTDEE